MPRKTKSDQFNKFIQGYHQLKVGETPHRIGAKDGSVATKPVVPVNKTKAEDVVLEECLSWLHRHKIWARRMNVGKGSFGKGGFYAYGIVGSADITGILKFNYQTGTSGQRLEIETKAGKGGRLSIEQQIFKQDILNNDGLYFVVHGVEELEYYFKGLI